jgi:hypothetical protein
VAAIGRPRAATDLFKAAGARQHPAIVGDRDALRTLLHSSFAGP